MKTWFDRFADAMFDLPYPACMAASFFVIALLLAPVCLAIAFFPNVIFTVALAAFVGGVVYGALSLARALIASFGI